MPRIPAHTAATAPAESAPVVDRLERRYGGLLNVHAGMAHSPALIAAYDAMSTALAAQSTFDARTREAIALAVANENGCDYCQAAHTRSAVRAGLTAEQTIAIRADRVTFDDRLAALTSLVREAARDAGSVSTGTWSRAHAAGWTSGELAEAFAHVMANLCTNYFNHFAETELDLPAAPRLP